MLCAQITEVTEGTVKHRGTEKRRKNGENFLVFSARLRSFVSLCFTVPSVPSVPCRSGGPSMRAFVVALVVLAAAPSGVAQITSATISGTVKDQTQGVLPGVDVLVRNVDTGLSRSVVTDANGYFAIAGLPPGVYETRASLQGFGTAVERVTLAVAQEAGLSLTLKVTGTEE